MVGYGGCGYYAVAHGSVLVLAFDKTGQFGDNWGQGLDL